MKKMLIIILLMVFLVLGCSIQDEPTTLVLDSKSDLMHNQSKSNLINLQVLLLYEDSSENYLNIFHQLNQSLVASLETDKIAISDFQTQFDEELYDIIYIDPKVSKKLDDLVKTILIDFVNSGGYLILENDFAKSFTEEFTGFTEPRLIEDFSLTNLVYENAGDDISESQAIFRDYLTISEGFKEYSTIEYSGYSVKPTTAESIISIDDRALFTINQYGEGKVIFLSKMILNDELFNDSFSFESGDYVNDYYNYTFTSTNMMMRNSLIKYISKDIHGFALSKVLGINGRPSMAWQNHFEVFHSIKDDAMSKWIDASKEYRQIPSYSLIRIPFNWGKWHETITYYENQGDNSFIGELVDSAYSSGQNVYSETKLLMLEKYPHYNSYYTDVEDCFRASPDIAYLNDDNIPDLVTGSSNGNIYLYFGQNQDSIWTVDSGQKILLTNNTEINTGGSSVPVLYDIDNDEDYDIIAGSESGKVYIYINNGDMKFTISYILDYTGLGFGYSSPVVYDIDGDEIVDLIIGTSSGKIYFSKGLFNRDSLIEFNSELVELELNVEDTYTVPEIWDEDNDGEVELLVGTNDGYVRVFEIEYPKLTYVKDIEGQTQNRAGTYSIWGGHNSVPRTFDLNQDGEKELIVGQLQFSYGQPMDSENFIYEKELRDELQYSMDNYIDIYPHTYFHSYKGPELEAEELSLHEKAFAYYGIDWSVGGTNQHTWRINEDNPKQSILSEMNSGIWWNSGYWYPTNPAQPSYDTQFVWTMPFMLTEDEQTLDMILFSPISRYEYRDYYSYVGEYDMPITYYYHIDEDVLYNGGLKRTKEIALELNDIREQYLYNFNTEYQMAKSFLALFNTDINITSNGDGIYSITKETEPVDDAIKPYLNSIGVKLEEGEKMNKIGSKTDFHVDSDIYYREGDNVYFSLNKNKITFNIIDEKLFDREESHLVSVNMPVNITETDGIMNIEFLDYGLQEVRLYEKKEVEVVSEGWEIFENEEYKTIYKYGDNDILQISFAD